MDASRPRTACASASLPLPPIPASRLRRKCRQRRAQGRAAAAAMNTDCRAPFHGQQHAADQRPDDRADPADPERPADAGGPDRGRIERRGQRVGGDLAADDAEAGGENRHGRRRAIECPSWPIAPTANTAMKYTSASARNEKRSMMLPSAKVPTTPPTCSIDPIAAASETEAPRSLSTVGSQFARK